MKVLVDTSAFYALGHEGDHHHARAHAILEALRESGPELVTTNYVVVECLSLVQRRRGVEAAVQFLEFVARALNVIWVDPASHEAARQAWQEGGIRRLSFVDCASFIVMRDHGIDTAFAFDRDFQTAGFRVAGAPSGGTVREPRARYRSTRRTPR